MFALISPCLYVDSRRNTAVKNVRIGEWGAWKTWRFLWVCLHSAHQHTPQPLSYRLILKLESAWPLGNSPWMTGSVEIVIAPIKGFIAPSSEMLGGKLGVLSLVGDTLDALSWDSGWHVGCVVLKCWVAHGTEGTVSLVDGTLGTLSWASPGALFGSVLCDLAVMLPFKPCPFVSFPSRCILADSCVQRGKSCSLPLKPLI